MKRYEIDVAWEAGTSVPVTVYEQEGAGPLGVLFLHGVGGTGKAWTHQLRHLHSHGRLLAIDLPGFAGGQLPESVRTLSDLSPFVCRVLDTLGVDQVVWVGNSLGGRIALETALRAPERVQGLGLVCAAGVRAADVTVAQPGQVPPDEFDRLVFFQPERFTAKQSEASRQATSAARALYDRLASRTADMDFTERLGEIAVPAAVIWGRHDGVIPLPLGEKMAAGIPGAVLTVLERAAHAPQLEQPQGVNAALDELLQKVQNAMAAADRSER
jgi:2-hydroxy-6-oxonona-2,4-dienedioate hydrolase